MKHSMLLLPMLALLCSSGSAATADTLSDPTRPISTRAATSITQSATPTLRVPAIRVEAILLSNERSMAIVNGKWVRAGDWVGNAQIDAIRTGSVLYTRAGRQQTARLADRTIKVRHEAQHEDET